MLKLPVKILSDPERFPFIPFVISDAVFVNGTDLTITDLFNDRYTKKEVDDMFEALGTVMDFRGVVETEAQLPETAEPGDVYLVLHYEESTITHGVIWQDGKGWVDMGTPIDLDDYYVKEETDELVKTSISASERAQREITNNDIAKSLNEAKGYTDTKIYDLHIENYLTAEEVKEYVADNHTIPYKKGTPDEPLIISNLFPIMETGCNYYILMVGNIKATEEVEEDYVLPYGLYIINVVDAEEHRYKLSMYTEDGGQNIYLIDNDGVEDINTKFLNDTEDATVSGNITFTGTVKSTKWPEANDDVVNKEYLNYYVIEPVQRLIKRLNGEDV